MIPNVFYADVVEACNIFPKNVFVPMNLAWEVCWLLERRNKVKFTLDEFKKHEVAVMKVIDDMKKCRLLVCKKKSNMLQTTNNIIRFHG